MSDTARPSSAWWWIAAAFAAATALIVFAVRPVGVTGQADEYPLYFSFDVPLTVPAYTLTDEGTKRSYSGLLRGTLGGIPVTEAKYTYGSGAVPQAGGGTFSLSTKAGAFKDGQVLMTSDGKQTTLLFFGVYLGARVSFSITGAGPQLGGSGVTVAGLAETNFRSHEQYVAAVRDATAALAPGVRDPVIQLADQNLRLVREYQQQRTQH